MYEQKQYFRSYILFWPVTVGGQLNANPSNLSVKLNNNNNNNNKMFYCSKNVTTEQDLSLASTLGFPVSWRLVSFVLQETKDTFKHKTQKKS